ncbi:helix-turn-helix domain-containing protein [Saccharibacillus sp. CPCC 101409]|uniref:helix-turn-helix domain-containing protein n=1 Tax=Saccharibacillus sp. CPCC 101409 TaxID=3058041 RepID=UPI0026727C90|nr:helix-turn-helix domain-containing protein [Saccharibacillus sp. CPCC 101409]MDO3408986.1 helix-turn-helix domain-containing protein [Saccharibacillus sp. CPCC 101409]
MSEFSQSVKIRMRRILPANTYLNRLIWLGCLSVLVPILLIGSAYYHVSMSRLTAQFREDNQESLLLLKDRMEQTLGSIENVSLQLAVDPLIRLALDEPEYNADYLAQVELLNLFQVRRGTENLIGDIVFYRSESGTTLSNTYGYVNERDFRFRGDLNEALERGESGWMRLGESAKEGYISYVRPLPVMRSGRPEGLIVMQVDEKGLDRLLRSYRTSLEDQSLLVLGPGGEMLLRAESVRASGGLSGESEIRRIAQSAETSGSELVSGEDQRALLAFQRTSFGRTYVSWLPESSMIEQLGWIRGLIVVTALACLLFGLLFSVVTSRLAYNPVQRLLRHGAGLRSGQQGNSGQGGNEIEYIRSCLDYLNEQAGSLDRYVRSMQPDLRDRFFQKLLRGDYAGDSGELVRQCGLYGIDPDGEAAVLVVKVENLLKEKRFLPQEGAVIRFAVRNVMNELIQTEGLKGLAVEDGERESAALLGFAPGTPPRVVKESTARYADKVVESLGRYLSFSAAAGIGRPAGLRHLPDAAREARTALKYRLFRDDERVLWYEEPIRLDAGRPLFLYPKEIEERLIAALGGEDASGAEAALEEFTDRVRSAGSYNVISQCYHVLLSALIQALEVHGAVPGKLFGENLFEQLKENQTSREMHDWFAGMLFPAWMRIRAENAGSPSRQLLRRVCAQIESDEEGSLTLSECAARESVSPSVLSRLFKKEMGISFVEYMIEFKVNKAKRLLKETDCSVTEIAGMVGYSERNLNRAFRRCTQMSPGQYRTMQR